MTLDSSEFKFKLEYFAGALLTQVRGKTCANLPSIGDYSLLVNFL